MYGLHGWEWTLGGGLLMGLAMLLMWIVLIGLLVTLVVYLNNQDKTTK